MCIKIIAAALIAIGFTGAAHAQVSEEWALENHQGMSARSIAGICSTFPCDHITVMFDGRAVFLQFTQYSGHYRTFAGTADSEDPTLIDLDQVYFDGHLEANAGQCELIFKSGKLSQVICSALGAQMVFTGEGQ